MLLPADPLEPGAYLTDSVGLFQIISVDEKEARVWLEDCRSFEVYELTVKQMLSDRFRLVSSQPSLIPA